MIEQARQGTLAPTLAALAVDPAASPLGAGYEHPELVAEEVWRSYLTVIGDTERTREFERMIAALAPAEMSGVNDALRALDAPTLLVWGTADSSFGVKWAYQLRDTIPGASVIEVDGAKKRKPSSPR